MTAKNIMPGVNPGEVWMIVFGMAGEGPSRFASDCKTVTFRRDYDVDH